MLSGEYILGLTALWRRVSALSRNGDINEQPLYFCKFTLAAQEVARKGLA